MPTSDDDLVKATQLVLKYGVRTGHPFFFNQLYGRVDESSVAGDWVSAAQNTNGHTYEVAPVYTIMELEILRKCAHDLMGGEYKEQHDGLMVAGGSLSNLYGMHLARFRADPDILTRGAHGGPRLVAFCSEQAHYSYLKSCRLMGIGSDNLVRVKSDHSTGGMDVAALEEAIVATRQAGGTPFFVGSTAGTTVLGAYDDFNGIQDVIDRQSAAEVGATAPIWHHTDGCWGGSALCSPTMRARTMAGVERNDSIAWNPHKMMGAALQTSIFLVRHAGLLAKVNGTQASYLFQPDKVHREYDMGDKTIQCGRKTDAFKLWMMWKKRGDVGMAATVDKCFALAARLAERIAAGGDTWQQVAVPSCTNVCFRYVPKRLQPFDYDSTSQEAKKELSSIAPIIKKRMQEQGKALIGFQCDGFVEQGDVNFFRMVFAATDILEMEDVDTLMQQIDEVGRDL